MEGLLQGGDKTHLGIWGSKCQEDTEDFRTPRSNSVTSREFLHQCRSRWCKDRYRGPSSPLPHVSSHPRCTGEWQWRLAGEQQWRRTWGSTGQGWWSVVHSRQVLHTGWRYRVAIQPDSCRWCRHLSARTLPPGTGLHSLSIRSWLWLECGWWGGEDTLDNILPQARIAGWDYTKREDNAQTRRENDSNLHWRRSISYSMHRVAIRIYS